MTLEELELTIQSELGVLLYFSGEHCNVCHALRPKFKTLFDTKFPEIKQIFLDAQAYASIAVEYQVFSLPTILVFLDGKEFVRENRTINMHQLEEQLSRPYGMMVD
ncbi:MAG: thioredoxin-like [uncultured Sulfurovum sp.]|uniref:Thioredoxin-like n=1 Tax=uncultured Sulfurovum sp. TaxID=269237 RepID=A0A6S6U177_9BACT|nr:MAG: thioredoxin-like [uncultured Sulfurovum sp.]